MDFDGYGWGFGPFAHIVGAIVYGLFSLFVILVVIATLFLLVRFLLVATKAAQIYVAKNSPPRPVAPEPTTGPTRTAPDAAAPTTAQTRPVPRTRTPKTPPPSV
jgi:hypothetical protein